MNGNTNVLKSPNAIHTIPTSVYATDKDYEDQRYHSCDTQDYGGGMEQQTIKSPTNSSYYGEHSPNLNGVIGNIHLVRAKTEDVVGPYEVHQMGLKSSSLAQLGEEMHVIHHHHNSHPHDSNNNSTHNSIEPFLNIVPPPPHLAAELGRKCMAFNAEQVTIQKQVSDWLEDRQSRGEKSKGD